MKRVTSMILVVLLFLLPVGCAVEDDGTSTTTIGTPTTTTTQAVTQAKLVTLDVEKYCEYYDRDAFMVGNGEVFYDMRLDAVIKDPANAGCQFRVLVNMDGWQLSEDDAFEELVGKMRSDGMRVEFSRSGSFFAQGTREQLESIATLEPNYGYYLWLAPPWRPEGYSEVYSDVMAAWLDETTAEKKVRVSIVPAWNRKDAKTATGELRNADRLLPIDAGAIQTRTQAIGERYRGEKISVQYYYQSHAVLSCILTKEELLKMADDPEIRYIEVRDPVV